MAMVSAETLESTPAKLRVWTPTHYIRPYIDLQASCIQLAEREREA